MEHFFIVVDCDNFIFNLSGYLIEKTCLKGDLEVSEQTNLITFFQKIITFIHNTSKTIIPYHSQTHIVFPFLKILLQESNNILIFPLLQTTFFKILCRIKLNEKIQNRE